MSAFGIDFGCNQCVMAVVRKGGVEVVLNSLSQRRTPTFISYGGSARQVGDHSEQSQLRNIRYTVDSIKRLIGQSFTDNEFVNEVKAPLPYYSFDIVQADDDKAMIQVLYNDEIMRLYPEQVAAALFNNLKQITSDFLDGHSVTDVVISCPPFWSEIQRRTLITAAKIAGLNVLRIMNETTALALNYGLLRPLPKEPFKVLFFDMGHSCIHAALTSFEEGKLRILSTASHRCLGGRDFTRALMIHFADIIQKKHKFDPLKNNKARLRLFKGCEHVKKVLSANNEAILNIECLMEDTDVRATVTREEFENLCTPFFESVLMPVLQVVASTNTAQQDIHSIEVIGGGSRVPFVRRILSNWFGRDLMYTCNADESIAKGCALQAAMLSPNFRVKEFEVSDVSPYGIELGWGPVGGPEEDKCLLFPPLNTVPNSKLITFHRDAKPLQINVRFAGSTILPPGYTNDPAIGTYVISGIPDDGIEHKFKVKAKLDLNGLFSIVSAQQIETVEIVEPIQVEDETVTPAQPSESKMDVESPANDTGSDEIKVEEPVEPKKKKKTTRTDLEVSSHIVSAVSEKSLQHKFEVECSMAAQDKVVAETAEARNELESYVLEMRSQVQQYGNLAEFVPTSIAENFVRDCDVVEDWLYSDEGSDAQRSEYTSRIEALKTVGDAAISRKYEFDHRGELFSLLKSSIVKYQIFASSTEKKYAHIKEEEKKKVMDECIKIDTWLTKMMVKLDKLPKHQDPPVTTAELNTKRVELGYICEPIMNTPVPPPPKPKEPEKKEEKPVKEEKPEKIVTEESTAEPSPKPSEPSPKPSEPIEVEIQ